MLLSIKYSSRQRVTVIPNRTVRCIKKHPSTPCCCWIPTACLSIGFMRRQISQLNTSTSDDRTAPRAGHFRSPRYVDPIADVHWRSDPADRPISSASGPANPHAAVQWWNPPPPNRDPPWHNNNCIGSQSINYISSALLNNKAFTKLYLGNNLLIYHTLLSLVQLAPCAAKLNCRNQWPWFWLITS